MLDTLGEFLDRMTAISVSGDEYLASPTPAGLDDLSRTRAEQARIITAYQLFVHREVFEPLIASGSPEQVRRAKELKIECIMLAEEFRAFARCWAPDGVSGQWDAYRAAALDFSARIRTHARNIRMSAPAYLGGRQPMREWRIAS